jgi:predicted nuclease of predicted toxin-antitoxin system
MLKLLLDEHIPPAVARGLKMRIRSIEVHALRNWQGGSFLGQPDEVILDDAASLNLTLVTYDLDTIPKVLSDRMRVGLPHGGVVFIPQNQIRSSDVGGIVHALSELHKREGKADWTNRVVFIRRRS